MKYLDRCKYLARLGGGWVESNPQVGALILNIEDNVVAEGYHKVYGSSHAEVNTFKALEKSEATITSESKMYVSLEPCNHQGKTGPCTKAIVDNKIKNLIIGALDSNPEVEGGGYKFLKDRGINLEWTKENTSSFHNPLKYFQYYNQYKKPYVTIKFARSNDGFISREGQRTKISSHITDRYVHKLRSEHQAILVGTNTLAIDQPKLDLRFFYGRNPDVVILDRTFKLSGREDVFLSERNVYYFTTQEQILGARVTENPNVQVIVVPKDNWNLNAILTKLGELNVSSLFVEGGLQLIKSFLDDSSWSEIIEIVSPLSLGSGTSAPKLMEVELIGQDKIDRDQLYFYKKLNNA